MTVPRISVTNSVDGYIWLHNPHQAQLNPGPEYMASKVTVRHLQASLAALDKSRYAVNNRGGRLVLTLFDRSDRDMLDGLPYNFIRIRSSVEFPDQFLVCSPTEERPKTVSSRRVEEPGADDSSLHNLGVESVTLKKPASGRLGSSRPPTTITSAHFNDLDTGGDDHSAPFGGSGEKPFRWAR